MKNKEIVKISKWLSLVLRHKPEIIDLELDDNGWAEVSQLLKKAQSQNQLTMELLEEVVATNNKKRFAFNEDKTKIRASQGHSIDVDLKLEPQTPPALLYHGTAYKNADPIKEKGLIKGSRQHVHLSKDIETAENVGKRHGKNVVILYIDAEKMCEENYEFYLSDNGVWLTDHVPPKYIYFNKGHYDVSKRIDRRYKKHDVLLTNIKSKLPELEALLDKLGGLSYEDRMYRFYHGSFKVYWMQEWTEEIVEMLREVSPHDMKELMREDLFAHHSHFCKDFDEIYSEGTGWEHKLHHNGKWGLITRPIVEAFLHSKYFLEMAVKYGHELDEAPSCMPSGWAALTELYRIR